MFFFSPYFSTQEKQEALTRVLDGADEVVLNFLELLIENHRMPVIFRMRQQFERLWEQENQMLPVEITSAIALDAGDDREPRPAIGERAGRKVTLAARVDPDILGGHRAAEWATRSSTPLFATDWSSCAGTLPKEPPRKRHADQP